MSCISVSVNGGTVYSVTPVPKRSLSMSRTTCVLSKAVTAMTFRSLSNSRVNQVAESVFHAFGDSVRGVNDEHTPWCAQFTQERRERATQRGLELDGQF